MRRTGIVGFLTASLFVSLTGETKAQQVERPKRLYVLLSASTEAPTPRQVVEEWDFVSKPPSHGLAAGAPTDGHYLIPVRATGDFKQLLDGHPETPRAKLERYIVLDYPEPTDLSSVIDALEDDPNIEGVHEPQRLEFSGASLLGYGIEPEPAPLGSDTAGYERDALNINRAWNWAGGYGLIGIADTGLSTQHPELRSFTSAGTFTRGNCLLAYSLDAGRRSTTTSMNGSLSSHLTLAVLAAWPAPPTGARHDRA